MRDNLPATQDGFAALPDHRILALEGPDAARFAHAQFMSDVVGLADSHWQWSGWLTPKGRVVALFVLLRFDSRSLWLLLPDADPAALRDDLQRFVFRSKVALTVRSDLRVAGGFTHPYRASGSRLSSDGHVELDVGAPAGQRTLRIADRSAAADDNALLQWKAYDLQHGLPRLDPLQAGAWTPQQLSLERLNAFSVRKGCYPGQEIVARTHFLGQAKRQLVLLESDRDVASGTDVIDGARAIGTVVSSVLCDGTGLALAVLPLDAALANLKASDRALVPRPLLDGLAR
ncbi:MAG: YgfZ/GcvT domain-containing protein [Luteimonas sp.]